MAPRPVVKDFDPFKGGNSGFAARVCARRGCRVAPGFDSRCASRPGQRTVRAESIARAAASYARSVVVRTGQDAQSFIKISRWHSAKRSGAPQPAVLCLEFGHGLRGTRWGRQAELLLPDFEYLVTDAELGSYGLGGLAAALPQLHGRAFEVQIVTGLPVLNRG